MLAFTMCVHYYVGLRIPEITKKVKKVRRGQNIGLLSARFLKMS